MNNLEQLFIYITFTIKKVGNINRIKKIITYEDVKIHKEDEYWYMSKGSDLIYFELFVHFICLVIIFIVYLCMLR